MKILKVIASAIVGLVEGAVFSIVGTIAGAIGGGFIMFFGTVLFTVAVALLQGKEAGEAVAMNITTIWRHGTMVIIVIGAVSGLIFGIYDGIMRTVCRIT